MSYIKWTLRIVIGTFLFAVAHYTLPQHDVVRVVNTYQERQDLDDWTRLFWAHPDDQSAGLVNRDVQFIQTVKKKTWALGFFRTGGEEVMVYRNEDTGWSWPYYFKFDTASLQTEADDLRSTKEAPKWAVITHYGWRNQLWTVFPNAVAIRQVDSPDAMVIPWFNIFFFGFILFAIGMIRAMWLQFRERTIDPAWDDVHESVTHQRGRLTRWLDSWRSKK